MDWKSVIFIIGNVLFFEMLNDRLLVLRNIINCFKLNVFLVIVDFFCLFFGECCGKFLCRFCYRW